MDKTKIQKVNKALIATVFATSGITVVVPPQQKAAAATSPFKDITPYDSHYDNILSLYSQGAINGYTDKTFRPNNNVTRGQAAKMLATVLGLSLNNLENPYFTDVPTSNEYYKYIAALENAGIMSGYSNGSFLPNEFITRGQLAKILVLGFKFEVASIYNHNFQDVNSQTSNAAYIQTLVDLKITEGTTPVTFSPYKAVTRGQIASFIVRSQDKKANATSYKITNIEDNIVYINAVPYIVPRKLANVINEGNKQVLKGAIIEGTFTKNQLSYISKLTLNASGTSKRFLKLNGNNESFGATIVVNGNYIEFADITLTGTTIVNETVRPPLNLNAYSLSKPLSFSRVASNNISFINWSNPDFPDNSSSTNNSSTDLQDWINQNTKPDKPFENWSKDKTTMKNVEKQIKFYNSYVSRLVVSQSGTKIETNITLPRVDIIGNVQNFEIQGNIKTLNLETETKLTIFGESDINWINYNSYTDLELYFDGRVGTLFVDNSYGWIDVGDYTYVNKVILPKDEKPNNIFDDFYNDNENIGGITDPDGKPIDKDDIENQKPVDKTKPIVNISNLQLLSGSEIKLEFTSDEVGTYYYVVREKGAEPPTKREMVNRVSVMDVASGTGAAVNGKNTINVSNLGEKKEYVIYVMVVDGAKNASDIVSQAFQMKDGTPPKVNSLKAEGLHGGQRAEFTFTASEPGDYYYYVRKKTTAPDPTTADIVANPTGTGKAKTDQLGIRQTITGLDPESEYQIYVVMKDTSGNYSVNPASTSFRTSELDNVQPFIPIDKQKLEMTGINQFTVYFSEPLDEEAALDVKNYVLSGTGIVNISGQKEIMPSQVAYKKGDTKAILTVPSTTGLINNDTIRVTIQKTLYDRAMNEFENITTQGKPRNYAVYTHGDTEAPGLTIEKFESNIEWTHGLLDVKATEAGTYYYVILPVDNKLTEKTPDEQQRTMRDIMDKKLKALLPQNLNNNLALLTVPLNLYGGSKAIEIGKNQLEIPIPNNLTEFHAWNIYIFMTDRSGNLTPQFKTVEMVKDRTAPTVTQGKVIPQKGDKTAKLDINSNEGGQIRYLLKLKGEIAPTLDEVKKSSNTLELKEGPQTTLEFAVPVPHKDYVLYYIAEDKAKNATSLQQAEFYADGTKPEVEDIVVRNGNTFEITFSEAIMRGEDELSTINLTEGSPLDSLLSMTGASLSDYQFVSYTQGLATTDKSKLVIKFVGTPPTSIDKSFEVKMKSDVEDSVKAKNTFDLNNLSKYAFVALSPTVEAAVLSNAKGNLVTNMGTPFSKELFLRIQLNQQYNYVEFYYLVTNGAAPTNVQEIIHPSNTSNLIYGSETVRTNTSRIEQVVSVRSDIPYSFVAGDRIYIVLRDQYGNVSPISPMFSIVAPSN